MSDRLEELPLFPLNTVLFPYAELYLHIFEERYKEMVNLCLKEDRTFGVVLIRSGSEVGQAEPYLVGTAVKIVGAHSYEDGRMDIHVRGERRFRIRDIDEDQAYLVGRVEPVFEMDAEEDSEAQSLLALAKDEVEALIQKVFARKH